MYLDSPNRVVEGVSQNLRTINGRFKTTSGNVFGNYMNIFHKTKVQTCSAPQNDSLNFSFVKDIHKFWETPSIISISLFRCLHTKLTALAEGGDKVKPGKN